MSQTKDWHLFTRGPLFEAVQALGLFRDSKTFPDMIPNGFDLADEAKVAEVLGEFVAICRKWFLAPVNSFRQGLDELKQSAAGPVTIERLKQVTGLGKGVIDFRSHLTDFINKHFLGRSETTTVKGLPREPTCSMEAYIDSVWSLLRRDSRNLPQEMFTGTLIPLSYPYVVTGGRFDEIYYWDGYFTGEGLVLSGGLDLFHCMLKNYLAFIWEFGFIPNGNRHYYTTRSQPPFFYCMVDLLGRMKGLDFLKKARLDINGESVGYLDMVEKEYLFWMAEGKGENDRAVRLADGSVLNRYWDHFYDDLLQPHVQPRPEAYHEDIANYADTEEGTNAAMFFRHIRAAAESGWDFSSRWFRPEPAGWEGIRRGMPTIRTTDIVPIDLNALLYGMERKLHEWTGDQKYADAANRRKQATIRYCWNEELGWFFDYCTAERHQGQTDVWSLAGAYPLFTRMLDEDGDREKVDRMEQTLRERFLRTGGVVTTLHDTGQQWDYPNGWAPLQWIVIRGLVSYGHRKLALEIAKRFIGCVGRTYLREGRIMEKYNVCEPEATAGGGEYVVQHGFGWTNGVVKALMVEFRSEMEEDPNLRKLLG